MKRTFIIAATVAALSASTGAYATHVFSDVPDDHPHSRGIYWAEQQRIMQGYSDGTFRPDQAVTRAQLATTMSNLWDRLGDDSACEDYPYGE